VHATFKDGIQLSSYNVSKRLSTEHFGWFVDRPTGCTFGRLCFSLEGLALTIDNYRTLHEVEGWNAACAANMLCTSTDVSLLYGESDA